MKNVLLIGDSIRVGYDKSVRNTLEGRANVFFPEENCRFAAYVLRHLAEWCDPDIKGTDVDVVHWNTGLWDCLRLYGEDVQTPLEIYAYYIERVCQRFAKIYPNAKFIFATSTSVQEEKMVPASFMRYNKDIEEYNRTAVEIVKKYGHEVNDLYSVSASLPAEAHSDAVHYYTSIGTEAFTNEVLKAICKAIGIEEELVYREEMHTAKPVGI